MRKYSLQTLRFIEKIKSKLYTYQYKLFVIKLFQDTIK